MRSANEHFFILFDMFCASRLLQRIAESLKEVSLKISRREARRVEEQLLGQDTFLG